MPTTVVYSVPVQRRDGVILTPSFAIPSDMPDGQILVRATIPTADYEDPANQLFADLYVSDLTLPGGWRLMATNRPGGWKGGPFVDDDGVVNPPPILFSLGVTPTLRGRTFRCEFDIPTRMRAGLEVLRVE